MLKSGGTNLGITLLFRFFQLSTKVDVNYSQGLFNTSAQLHTSYIQNFGDYEL